MIISFIFFSSQDGMDSLGSSGGIDIREQLERAAARASYRPDEASEELQTAVHRRFPQHTESPRFFEGYIID